MVLTTATFFENINYTLSSIPVSPIFAQKRDSGPLVSAWYTEALIAQCPGMTSCLCWSSPYFSTHQALSCLRIPLFSLESRLLILQRQAPSCGLDLSINVTSSGSHFDHQIKARHPRAPCGTTTPCSSPDGLSWQLTFVSSFICLVSVFSPQVSREHQFQVSWDLGSLQCEDSP